MKVVLIIAAFMVGGVVLALIKEGSSGGSSSGGSGGYGLIGVVIAMAIGAGVKAIWNYGSDKPEEKKTSEIEKLDKN